MSVHTLVQPEYERNVQGAEGPMIRGLGLTLDAAAVAGAGAEPYLKETASQAYGVGALVYIDSNGTIAIATVSGANLNSAVLGFATKAATGTTGVPVQAAVIRESDRFRMQVFHSTPALSVTAQAQLGVKYRIIKSNDLWHVDIENTTVEDATTALAKVEVTGFPVGNGRQIHGVLSEIDDTNGWVEVKFLPFTIQTDGGGLVRNLQG